VIQRLIMKRNLWFFILFMLTWGITHAQFVPLSLPVENGALNDLYLGQYNGGSPLYWSRAWDYGQGKIYPQNNVISLGGPVPDSAMIAYIDTVNPRIAGHGYISSQMGIPFWKAGPDSTYFTFPNGSDTFAIASGSNGFFRLHHGLRYIYNSANVRSTKYRDISDSTLGRFTRVRNNLNSGIENIVDPYLQPASNRGWDFGDGNNLAGTTLSGDDVPTVRWTLFSLMFEEDNTTIPFHWPGFHTGDYTNTGTDGPHFAFNIWQVKGKYSSVVPISIKWRGQQLIVTIQNPNGTTLQNPVILGPNAISGFTDSLSSYANQWLDFLVRTKPGFTGMGDNPGVRIYFKEATSTNWNLLFEYNGDLLSEVEANALSLQGLYGLPTNYLGLPNGGIYPSSRFQGSILRNYWTPFRMAHPDQAFMKIRHSEYMFAEFGEGAELGNADIFSLANAAMPPLNGSGSGSLPVEYLRFEAVQHQETVDLYWATANELNNDYFEVEKSTDGIEWEYLQTQEGAGTSSQVLSYKVNDPHPYPGLNYYRIKQVDLDGKTSLSPVRRIRIQPKNDFAISIYPNPVSESQSFTLRVPAFNDAEDIKAFIVDSKGAVVFSRIIQPNELEANSSRITLSPTLPAGLYVIHVEKGASRQFKKLWVN